MGSSCSSNNTDGDFQTLLTDYTILLREKDPHYGDVTLLEHKTTHDVVALKEILSKSASDFQHDMKSLNQKLLLQHPNIVRLISLNAKAEDKVCSSFFRIQFLIEYNDNDLEKEISERVKNGEGYTEEQLWYLFECVIQGLNILYQRGVTHGDIKPSSIFRSKIGCYKIAEQDITAGVPVYAQRVGGVTDAHGYLSPELLQALSRGEIKPKHNAHKSDIFALGMTILQAATLSNCEELYDWEKNELKLDELNERMGFLAISYSNDFQRLVKSMLILDATQRLSAPELIKLIPRKNDSAHDRDVIVEEEERAEVTQSVKTEENKRVTCGIAGDDEPVNSEVKLTLTQQNTEEEKQYQMLTQGGEREDTVGFDKSLDIINDERDRGPQVQEKTQKEPQLLIEDLNAQEMDQKKDLKMRSESGKAFPEIVQFDMETDGSAKPTDGDQKSYKSHTDPIQISLPKKEHVSSEISNAHSKLGGLLQQFTTQTNDNTNSGVNSVNGQSGATSQSQSIVGLNRSQGNSAIDVSTSHGQMNPNEYVSKYQPKSYMAGIGPQPTTGSYIPSGLGTKSAYYGGLTGSITQSGATISNADSAVNNQINPAGQYTKYQPLNYQSQQAPSTLATHTQLSSNPTYNFEKYQPISTTTQPYSNVTSSINQQPSASGQSIQNNQYVPYKFQTGDSFTQNLSRRPLETEKRSGYPGTSGFDSTNTETYNAYITKNEESKLQHPGGNTALRTQQNYILGTFGQTQAYPTQQYGKPQLGIDPYKTDYTEKSQKSYPASDPYSVVRSDVQGVNRGANPNIRTPRQMDSNGERLEFVTETYADGSIYEGEKKGPYRHGRGRFYYSDGGLYDGDWRNGTMHGIGTLFYGNGQVAYEGEWFEDKFHGRGAVHNENPMPLIGDYDYKNFENLGDYWVMYDGEFSHDCKEGLGVLYLSNGDRFEGEFRADMVHGHGTYIFLNGRQVTGEWWNNRLVQ